MPHAWKVIPAEKQTPAMMEQRTQYLTVVRNMQPHAIYCTRVQSRSVAFLMLIETGSDFPWMCGLNTGVLNEIAAHLPWNVTPYRESKDDFWAVFTKEDLENTEDCPEDFAYAFDTKQYLEPKFDDGKMSFEQILFMKTGCMLPADLWKYQRLAPEL